LIQGNNPLKIGLQQVANAAVGCHRLGGRRKGCGMDRFPPCTRVLRQADGAVVIGGRQVDTVFNHHIADIAAPFALVELNGRMGFTFEFNDRSVVSAEPDFSAGDKGLADRIPQGQIEAADLFRLAWVSDIDYLNPVFGCRQGKQISL